MSIEGVTGLKIEIIQMTISEWIFTVSMFFNKCKYQSSGVTTTPDTAFIEAMKFVELVTKGLST